MWRPVIARYWVIPTITWRGVDTHHPTVAVSLDGGRTWQPHGYAMWREP